MRVPRCWSASVRVCVCLCARAFVYVLYTNYVIIIIIIISIQPLGQFGQEPEPSQATGMALVRCILGKFLRVVCRCFPPRITYIRIYLLFIYSFIHSFTYMQSELRKTNGAQDFLK